MVSLLEERGVVVKMEVFQYDDETERYNGFHCGDCFRIKVKF